MEDIITLSSLNAEQKSFWIYFFSNNYPNGYDEENDLMLSEYLIEKYQLSLNWVNEFTKYYDGIMDKTDGYIENPRSLVVKLGDEKNLLIEFHPGDTIFYINEKKIGNTGGHYEINKLSLEKILSLCILSEDEKLVFSLLLPMLKIEEEENEHKICLCIKKYLTKLPFRNCDHDFICKCIIENSRE